jgi:GT2 family glycosyltransferase
MTVGIVVIGRNEGERLVACLRSLGELVHRTVYVDSGSTDGSVAAARDLGAAVTVLDTSLPFTAARARNHGLAVLVGHHPDIDYVQFVDGDCLLDGEWPDKAKRFLEAHPDVAVVCGRRRERFPERSIYNRLCDREWDTGVGEALECGGDMMARRDALDEVGGYADDLIAGEEPEMCLRLRDAGWRIWRLDAEMTLHDANLLRFGQWWRRMMRGGHAFAEVSTRHAGSRLRIWRRQTWRAVFWGLLLPAGTVLLALLLHPALLLLLLIYPLQVLRLARGGDWGYACFIVLAKFPEMLGVLRYFSNRLLRRAGCLIEYK